jgi:hypothetical protein
MLPVNSAFTPMLIFEASPAGDAAVGVPDGAAVVGAVPGLLQDVRAEITSKASARTRAVRFMAILFMVGWMTMGLNHGTLYMLGGGFVYMPSATPPRAGRG